MKTLPKHKILKIANTRQLQELIIIAENFSEGTVVVPDNWQNIIKEAKTPTRKVKAWQKNRHTKSKQVRNFAKPN